MAKVKVAVLGTGSLGQHHVRIYSELQQAGLVELTGVYDSHPETARKIAEKNQTRVFGSIAEAARRSDALNIVTPTTTHFEIASELLNQGKHVLVEKPMTDDSVQAGRLIELAQQKNCVLQVGHVERFNPVFNILQTVATEPRFIECSRLSPFPARSTDIGVVLDLMIHDLDIVLAFVKSPVTSVDGVSGPTDPCYISLDYRLQEGYITRVARDDEEESSLLKKALTFGLGFGKDSAIVSEFAGKKIVREPVPIAKEEPLKLELQSFVACVREKQTPIVSGESAKRALDLAFEITRQIQQMK
ncbi:MAG: Gfo/Idh/MocA family oxidoreductase [Verrucomicrobiota bacterium]